MATAEKIIESVPVTTTKEMEVGVKLNLNREEAYALALILARIGGGAEDTARGFADQIENALRGAGYKAYRDDDALFAQHDSIYFSTNSRSAVIDAANRHGAR